MKFILARFKHSVKWTIIIFSKTGTGGRPCSCLYINMPEYKNDNQVGGIDSCEPLVELNNCLKRIKII